jgi:hypothetical protein
MIREVAMLLKEPVHPNVRWARALAGAQVVQPQIEKSREAIARSRALLARPVHKPMWAASPDEQSHAKGLP